MQTQPQMPTKILRKGSQIVVKDNKGSVLGTSVLEQGAIANLSFNGSCEFPFSIQNLPQNDFYTVEVGNRTVILSKQTLEASSWKADLVIASNSLQVNSASIDEKTLKEWDAIRQVEKTSQKLELERASREETSETKQVKTETCIAQKELAEQWQGEPISKECEQFLKDLETQKP